MYSVKGTASYNYIENQSMILTFLYCILEL